MVIPSIESDHNNTNKMTCLPSKDSDQPEHPTSLICLPKPSSGRQSRLYSDWADSLHWAHMSLCLLCCSLVQKEFHLQQDLNQWNR